MNEITLIGNENRLSIVADMLYKKLYTVKHITRRDELNNTDISNTVILPIPYKDALGKIKGTDILLSDIAPKLKPESLVILGKADGAVLDIAGRIGFSFCDICEDKSFKVLNAIPTAEAAISIAMDNIEHTLYGSNVVICGYGCIAKCLARLTVAFGCNVTVAARKTSDLYEAELMGCRSENISKLRDIIGNADIIFNTCPAPVLDAAVLENVKRGVLIIDLASRPGGCDFEYARQNGINAKLCLSLPDQYSPVTSGKNMYKMIRSILDERT